MVVVVWWQPGSWNSQPPPADNFNVIRSRRKLTSDQRRRENFFKCPVGGHSAVSNSEAGSKKLVVV